MTQISTHEAKARFSELLASVERSGEPVIIFRYGHPVARLMPVERPRRLDPDLFADDSDDWEAMQ